ncbi:MAG: hypothetical protein KBT46_04100 [Ruminococcus sp.]|nr:hypothetical protein [Candidatus Copronaster equi]
MKKITKTAISIVLCLLLSLSVMLPCFAKEEKTAFIVVSGMNTVPLYCSDERVFGPEASVITSAVMKSLPSVMQFLVERDYDKLANGLLPAVRSMFEKLSCNPDGTSKYDISCEKFFGRAADFASTFENEETDEFALVRSGMEAFGAENTYFYNYDWRLSPLDDAEELHDYIEMVKSKDNYDRIVLAAYSMGGTVVCSYLYKYGSSDIDTLALCSTAFQGTTSVGTLFTGEFCFSMSGLMRRFAELARDNFWENFLNTFNKVLNASGINESIENIANDMSYKMLDKIYSEVITPVFGYLPGLWALCDSERFETAKENILDTTANAELIKMIDEYKYNVQDKAFELLKDAEKDTNVYVIAQYNRQGLPVSKAAATSNNDNLIDTEFESGGAVCSLLGQTLPDGYVQAVDCGHNHISYDKNIDASTCMFPEQTWFIRDMMHVDYPYGEAADFIIWLMQSENQLTIHSNARYPQFMIYSYDNNTLSPLDETHTQKTTVDTIFSVLNKIIDMLSSMIKFILK